MPFGILDTDPSRGNPPGTSILEKVQPGTTGASAVLIPRPSNSPNDPLNMPRLRKELYFLTLIYGACVTGVMGPLLVPGFSIVAASFGVSLTDVTLLNGALVMALGVSAYLCGPLATLYGRRVVYLATTLVMLVGCVWASYAGGYRSLLGARVLQGLGMGAFFSLAGTASVNDVFFVHERGRRAGLWNFAVIVSVNVAPVVSGYVITALGWRWSFRILALAFALALIFIFLLMPETLFTREEILGVPPPEEEESSGPVRSESVADEEAQKPSVSIKKPSPLIPEEAMDDTPGRVALWRRCLGMKNFEPQGFRNLLPMMLSPILLLRHPAILWACAMWSVTFSWTIILGGIADQIYTAPPYQLSATAVGLLIGVPPLIGSALGTLFGGWMCDEAAKVMSIRQNGIYEPEFRLVVLIPGFITIGIGCYGLGITINDGLSIWASAVFLGFLNFGVGIGCTGIIAYTNDLFQHKSADAFGVAMVSSFQSQEIGYLHFREWRANMTIPS